MIQFYAYNCNNIRIVIIIRSSEEQLHRSLKKVAMMVSTNGKGKNMRVFLE